jgi:NADH-quinone oxidoreductase subunit L
MFVGWEGVGLCSYLLIGFWYTNSAPTQAGKKAFIVNRIGDAGFIIGLMLLVTSPLAVPEHGTTEGLRTLSYQPLFDNVIHLIESDPATFTATLAPLVTIITICLFFGATGKSAQLPLYTWLPDAMEGPTPVSALIHAATMVTAGVYMVARSHVLFAISPTTMAIIAIVGAVTAIFAATIALVQTDIKRVLAYSTISQLGYMFVGCGTGAFFAGIFHLMTHAFFKACLFLGAGSVIIGCHHEQDMRKMGGLRKFMPITAWTFLVATLAIAGAPGLAGFFSKDTILHEAFTLPFAAGSAGQFAGIVGYITALLTAGYMFRLYLRTFEGPYLGDEHHKPHETLPSMTGVLVVLAILSVLGGWVGFSTNYQQATPIQAYLNPVFHHGVEAAAHYLEVEEVKSPPYVYMLVSIIAFALGLFLMYTYIRQNPEIQRNLKLRYHAVYKMLWEKYRVDELYANLFTKPGTWLCGVLWKNVDEHVIDDGLVEGTGRATEWLGQAIRPMQTGFLRSYALYIVIGVAILILLASV